MTKPILCDQPVLRLNIPCYDMEIIKSIKDSSPYSWLPHPFEIDENLSDPKNGIVHVFSRWEGETAPKAESLASKYFDWVEHTEWKDKVFPWIPANIEDLPERGSMWRADKDKTQTYYYGNGVLFNSSYEEKGNKINYILEKMGIYYEITPYSDPRSWTRIWEEPYGTRGYDYGVYTYVDFTEWVSDDIVFEFMYRYMRFQGDNNNFEGFPV